MLRLLGIQPNFFPKHAVFLQEMITSLTYSRSFILLYWGNLQNSSQKKHLQISTPEQPLPCDTIALCITINQSTINLYLCYKRFFLIPFSWKSAALLFKIALKSSLNTALWSLKSVSTTQFKAATLEGNGKFRVAPEKKEMIIFKNYCRSSNGV